MTLGLLLLIVVGSLSELLMMMSSSEPYYHYYCHIHQSDTIVNSTHSHNTRSVAHNNPRAFVASNAFYHSSFLLRASRELRSEFLTILEFLIV